jgi:hypothetical protein
MRGDNTKTDYRVSSKFEKSIPPHRFEQNVGLRTDRRELLGDRKRYWALVTVTEPAKQGPDLTRRMDSWKVGGGRTAAGIASADFRARQATAAFRRRHT